MNIKHLLVRLNESMDIITLLYLFVVSIANMFNWVQSQIHFDDYIGFILAGLAIIFRGITLGIGGRLYD